MVVEKGLIVRKAQSGVLFHLGRHDGALIGEVAGQRFPIWVPSAMTGLADPDGACGSRAAQAGRRRWAIVDGLFDAGSGRRCAQAGRGAHAGATTAR